MTVYLRDGDIGIRGTHTEIDPAGGPLAPRDTNVQDWSEDELFDQDEEQDMELPKKGQIFHFIPSEHMKLVKDIQAKKDLPPIFLRSLAAEQDDLKKLNIFSSVPVNARPPPQATKTVVDRFNEHVYGKGMGNKSKKKGKAPVKQETEPMTKEQLQLALGSTNVFRPEKYLQTKGLNIVFDDVKEEKGPLKPQNQLEKDIETLFAMPFIMKQESSGEKIQVPVGKKKGFKEGRIQ